jgi:hypothetical protein
MRMRLKNKKNYFVQLGNLVANYSVATKTKPAEAFVQKVQRVIEEKEYMRCIIQVQATTGKLSDLVFFHKKKKKKTDIRKSRVSPVVSKLERERESDR